MRDWRAFRLEKVGFVSIKGVPVSQLAGISAPFLCCSEVELETTEHKYDFDGDLTHLCSFRESFKGTMFSSTDLHMKNLFRSVLSGVENGENDVGEKNDVPNICQVILNLVSYRNVLQKHQGRNVVRL